MISALTGLSPLSPVTARPPARSRAVSEDPFVMAEEPADPGRGRKWLAAGLLGVTGLSMVGGAGIQAAAHLPVCQQTQHIVGWEHGQPCVSLEVAVQGATAERYLKAPFHLGGAVQSWQSGHNQVFGAPSDAPRLGAGDHLKVVSWNLHHGLSQDSTGARPQLDSMIHQLQDEDADVILLQEVQPGDAAKISQGLEMQGYYAMSTPVQGNLILLRPDMQVHSESVVFTTGQSPSDAVGTLKHWVSGQGGQAEPRNLQILNVELPAGQSAVIWNTHNLTGDYTEQQRNDAAQRVVDALRQNIQPGELVIGGGDLNASSLASPLIGGLNELPGISGQQEKIDWIYASNSLRSTSLSSEEVVSGGMMLSDHPLVRTEMQLH